MIERVKRMNGIGTTANYLYILKYFLFDLVVQNKTPIFESACPLVLETDLSHEPRRCALCVPLHVYSILLCQKSYTHTLYIFGNYCVVGSRSFLQNYNINIPILNTLCHFPL
jgi:hypothetical protein